jgi:hypothetical protein
VADDRLKLESHRKAIQEHIEKWQRYESDYDKRFALDTISRIQEEIRRLKARNSSLDYSWEDDWSSSNDWSYNGWI